MATRDEAPKDTLTLVLDLCDRLAGRYEQSLRARLLEIQEEIADLDTQDTGDLTPRESFLLRETILSLQMEHLRIYRHLNVGSDL